MLSLLRPRLSQPLYKGLVSCIPSFRSFSANMMMENQPSLPVLSFLFFLLASFPSF